VYHILTGSEALRPVILSRLLHGKHITGSELAHLPAAWLLRRSKHFAIFDIVVVAPQSPSRSDFLGGSTLVGIRLLARKNPPVENC
jgi:hypothetical protein